jgi:hypothetical protein
MLAGCGGKKEPDVPGLDGEGEGVGLPADCADEPIPATRIECTGLYVDVAAKKLSPRVRAFAPAEPFWSDGLEKQRWILLPKGEKIDASDPSEWKFPAGTKLFKQFIAQGKRLETRLFQKKDNGLWAHAAYAWNEDETEAPKTDGEDVPVPDGTTHEIPTGAQCDQCHKGRTDRVLGFEQVSLGLDGATGLTLQTLVDEDLIDPPPESTALSIGDDGTGLAAPAMGWLHVNCGVTCHNGNSGALAYGAKMRLRLDPALLDGRSSKDFESRTSTLDVQVNNPNWKGQTRIVPGDPDQSLMVKLISTRLSATDDNGQMPPIATRLVDTDHVANIVAWIKGMTTEVVR